LAQIVAMIEAAREPLEGVLSDSIVSSWIAGAKGGVSMIGGVEAVERAANAPGSSKSETGSAGPYSPGIPGVSGPGSSKSEPPPELPPPPGPTVGGGAEPLAEFPSIDAAVKGLLRREILTPEDFYALAGEAKAQAFTISGAITQNAIEKIRDLLGENVEGPAGRERFITLTREQVEGVGVSDAHLEHVYRNATNEAYSQGMETVLAHPVVADEFPYRGYYAIHDDRVEDTHLAMETLGIDGTNVYHKDDPTWHRFRPPWRWQCRCGWIALSVQQAANMGVAEAREWLKTGVEPVHIWVKPPPFNPDPAWERGPGAMAA
jgi:hypothetical protein